jgi:hypothetical protein
MRIDQSHTWMSRTSYRLIRKQIEWRILWDTRPCSPLKVNRRFGGTRVLHFYGRRMNQARNQHEAGSKQNRTCVCVSVGIVTRFRAVNRGNGVRISARLRYFSPLYSLQTGYGAHTAFYPMGGADCFPGNKAAEAWSWLLTYIKFRR